MNNKYFKIVGYSVTIVCIVFLIYRLSRFSLDFSQLLEVHVFFIVAIITFFYSLYLLLLPLVWRETIRITTEVSCSYFETAFVYLRSNLMKYIPGNVFQYIGRNEIAVRKGLNHAEVALSTVLEVAAVVAATAITAVCLYFRGFQNWLEQNTLRLTYLLIAVVCVLVLGFACIYIFRKKLSGFIKKIASLFRLRIFARFVVCVAFDMVLSIITAVLFLTVLILILGFTASFEVYIQIMGAYLISWLAGFLTPGSPGGIGVREVAITAILSDQVGSDIIMPGIIIYRIVTTVGDFLAFAISAVLLKVHTRISAQKSSL